MDGLRGEGESGCIRNRFGIGGHCRRELTGSEQRRAGHSQGQHHGAEIGARVTDQRRQVESRHVGAQDGAEGVDRVERRGRPPQFVPTADEVLTHHGQRSPHEKSGREEHPQSEGEFDDQENVRPVFKGLEEGTVDPPVGGQQEKIEKRAARDT